MTEHEFYTAIKGLAKGNKDMLHAIYDAYGRLIYTIVYDILKNREDAEDVTSEFFIKLIRVAGTYQKKTSHRAWLIQIARNMAIDLLRKRGHEYLLHETEDAPQDQLEEGGTVETASTVEEHVVCHLPEFEISNQLQIQHFSLPGKKFWRMQLRP